MRKPFASISLALAATLCCGAVLAQEAASFTQLSACRIDVERVLLKATFQGSPCWAVEPAQLAEPRGTTVAVHLPTLSTAEICTMNIVPVSTEQVIEAPEPTSDLEVRAATPQNDVMARGLIEVSQGQGNCLEAKG
ncbi:hypothetical protein GGR20_000485 [Devosia subaequoris]|uniref:Secreted protein n=1 Tax=Devosia subaequoris TaxID=395930 RepID=A0A7W6IJP3_9HYPH|nr:hypothetical protein [Devosia subaequoris]MBB4050867.1 hypothetical protein [Devosia subaequoris]MCP1208456.1 hypothetical protein [Devosia subaequoris]